MKKILSIVLCLICILSCFTFFGCQQSEQQCEHNYILISDTATCGEDGLKTYKCSLCEETYTKSSFKLNHSFVAKTCELCNFTVSSTWSSDSNCTKCGKVNIIGDNKNYYIKRNTTATCIYDGAATYQCTKCFRLFYVLDKALGHNWNLYSTDATCQKEGYLHYACKRCSEIKKELVQPSTLYCNLLYVGMVNKKGYKYMQYQCSYCKNYQYKKVDLS